MITLVRRKLVYILCLFIDFIPGMCTRWLMLQQPFWFKRQPWKWSFLVESTRWKGSGTLRNLWSVAHLLKVHCLPDIYIREKYASILLKLLLFQVSITAELYLKGHTMAQQERFETLKNNTSQYALLPTEPSLLTALSQAFTNWLNHVFIFSTTSRPYHFSF